MSQYGGVGLTAVRKWQRMPLATVAWLMGSMARRNHSGDRPEDPGALTAEDSAVLRMLEARLKAKQEQDHGGSSPSGGQP